MILEDAVETLKWKSFWKQRKEGGERLKDQLTVIAGSLELRNKDELKIICAAKSEVTETLKDLAEKFVYKAVNSSEICKYWEAFLKITCFLKDLIAADWTGNWDAHLLVVQNLLPLFRENDSINFLRYASIYLQQMRRLPIHHSETHATFMSRHFIAQQINGSFNLVSSYMKLEKKHSKISKNGPCYCCPDKKSKVCN